VYAQTAQSFRASEADCSTVEFYDVIDYSQAQPMPFLVLIQTTASLSQVVNISVIQSGRQHGMLRSSPSGHSAP